MMFRCYFRIGSMKILEQQIQTIIKSNDHQNILRQVDHYYSLCRMKGTNPNQLNHKIIPYLQQHFNSFTNAQILQISLLHPFLRNSLTPKMLLKLQEMDFFTLPQTLFLVKSLTMANLGEFRDNDNAKEIRKLLKYLVENKLDDICADAFNLSEFAMAYYKFYQFENRLFLQENKVSGLWQEKARRDGEVRMNLLPMSHIPLHTKIRSIVEQNRGQLIRFIDPIVTYCILHKMFDETFIDGLNKDGLNTDGLNIDGLNIDGLNIDGLNISGKIDFLLMVVKNTYPIDVAIFRIIRLECEEYLSKQTGEYTYQNQWSLQLNHQHLHHLGIETQKQQKYNKDLSLKQICDAIWIFTQYHSVEHDKIVELMIKIALKELDKLHLTDLINLVYGVVLYQKFTSADYLKNIFERIEGRMKVEKHHNKSCCLLYQIVRYLEILYSKYINQFLFLQNNRGNEFLGYDNYETLKSIWKQSRQSLHPHASKTEDLIVRQVLTNPRLSKMQYQKNALMQNLYYVDLWFPASQDLKNSVIVEVDSDLHEPKLYSISRDFQNGNQVLRKLILHRCKYQIITFHHYEYLPVLNQRHLLEQLVRNKLLNV